MRLFDRVSLGQGLFIVTLSGSEESSPDALREMLRFAQHDRLSKKYDFEKTLLTRRSGISNRRFLA